MDFYRANIKVNKNGNEEHKFAFVYGNKIQEVEDQLNQFELVKDLGFLPVVNFKKITEAEFVTGILLCSKRDFCGADELSLGELDLVCSRLCRLLDSGYKFQTEEGRSLKKYCDKFMTSNKKMQKRISSDYENWASELVGITENE